MAACTSEEGYEILLEDLHLLAMILAQLLFVPFYRKLCVSSIYEYLEQRFGTWTRLYAAGCYVLLKTAKTGIVLYMTSLALQIIVGRSVPLEMVMLVFGVVVAAYTTVGGLEAVIWTDLLQGIALIGGGLICMPIIAAQVPGGFAQIIDVAWEQGKFEVGSTDLTLLKVTLWATILAKFMNFCQLLGTDRPALCGDQERSGSSPGRHPGRPAHDPGMGLLFLRGNKPLRPVPV